MMIGKHHGISVMSFVYFWYFILGTFWVAVVNQQFRPLALLTRFSFRFESCIIYLPHVKFAWREILYVAFCVAFKVRGARVTQERFLSVEAPPRNLNSYHYFTIFSSSDQDRELLSYTFNKNRHLFHISKINQNLTYIIMGFWSLQLSKLSYDSALWFLPKVCNSS